MASVLLKLNAGGKLSEEEVKMMEDVISKGGNNKVQQIGQEAATTLAIHEKEVSVNEIQKDQVPNNASEVVTTKADQVPNTSLFFFSFFLGKIRGCVHCQLLTWCH